MEKVLLPTGAVRCPLGEKDTVLARRAPFTWRPLLLLLCPSMVHLSSPTRARRWTRVRSLCPLLLKANSFIINGATFSRSLLTCSLSLSRSDFPRRASKLPKWMARQAQYGFKVWLHVNDLKVARAREASLSLSLSLSIFYGYLIIYVQQWTLTL